MQCEVLALAFLSYFCLTLFQIVTENKETNEAKINNIIIFNYNKKQIVYQKL